MARKPRDYDGELQDLMERAKKVKSDKTIRLGEIVQLTKADSLSHEALAGVLLAAVEQAKKNPEAVARWTERGTTFFQSERKRGTKTATGDTAGGTTGNDSPAPALERAAE